MVNNFKFQKMLNLKQKQEEQLKIQLNNINNELKYNLDVLNNIKFKKQNMQRYVNNLLISSGLDSSALKVYNNAINTYFIMYKDRQQIIKKIVNKKQKFTNDLIDKMIERKTFEKLKNNYYKAIIKQQKKLDQNIIDEYVCFSNSKIRRD